MHDILILTEPVGGNAKITTQMHDILLSLNQWELVDITHRTSGVGGNAKITT
jgi:hypothetical protein